MIKFILFKTMFDNVLILLERPIQIFKIGWLGNLCICVCNGYQQEIKKKIH